MKHVKLISFTDENDTLGLVIEGTKLNADTTGMPIAHDLLEHQNGTRAIGGIADEIEAIGGMWQVRGRHADFCQDDARIGSAWTPEQNVILELVNLARYVPYARWQPRVGQYRTQAHFEDETFREMLDWVRPKIRSEVEDYPDFPMAAYLENALHLIRTGYRKAERRFGPNYEGITQFKAVKSAIKSVTREIEIDGQIFLLSYGKGKATCYETY